jgi:hypothetical protein
MKIDSEKVVIEAGRSNVASFLRDIQNIYHLLPQGHISDWKATENECSFKVQGGVVIPLIQDGFEDDERIFFRSGEKAPFPFKLTVHMQDEGAFTSGWIAFDGDVNVFLKMMVEKPLTNLFNVMSANLRNHFQVQK